MRFHRIRACCALALAALSFNSIACLELQTSPLDTSNGGLAGALLTALAGGDNPRFLAFGDTLEGFESTGDGVWTSFAITGATGSLSQVRRAQDGSLWGLDQKATDNVVRSEDDGRTWSAVSTVSQAFSTLHTCGTTIFTTFSQAGLWAAVVSRDSGSTWNQYTIDNVTIAPNDALCIDETTLYAAKNNNPPVSRSTDGGVNWGAGAALPVSPQVRIASRANGEVFTINVQTNPTTSLSTDGVGTWGSTDNASFPVGSGWFGALTAGNGEYHFFIKGTTGTSCDFHRSATGLASSFSTASVACLANHSLDVVDSGSTNTGDFAVVYGGNDTSVPLIYRYSDSTKAAVQDTLPANSSTAIQSIVYTL